MYNRRHGSGLLDLTVRVKGRMEAPCTGLELNFPLERAGFVRDDPPETKLDKRIAALLGIPTGARYPTLALAPQRQKPRRKPVGIRSEPGYAMIVPAPVTDLWRWAGRCRSRRCAYAAHRAINRSELGTASSDTI
jgi:hypothetical protein